MRGSVQLLIAIVVLFGCINLAENSRLQLEGLLVTNPEPFVIGGWSGVPHPSRTCSSPEVPLVSLSSTSYGFEG
jgi:hypothetical protein